MNPEYQPLAGVLTEKEVCEFLGITRKHLDRLRYDGLPFIRLFDRHRLYLESDLMELFKSRRIVFNGSETKTQRDVTDT